VVVEKLRFYEGVDCGHVRKYSDTLMICLLKARRPEKYADRGEGQLSGHLTIRWLEPSEEGPLTERWLEEGEEAPAYRR
jgi:hypothetical protein